MTNVQSFFSDQFKSSVSAVASYESDNFSDLVRLSGLSPATDFIGSNLSGVDFSNSDLRGYNFTDCNLTSCFGVNYIIDETTNLNNAIVNNSIFALEKEKREFFGMHSEQYALYQRLKGEYWTNGALWVGNNLRVGSFDFKNSSKIAKYLYGVVKDQTFKNQLLYGLRNSFDTKIEYKEFLIAQLSDRSASLRTIRTLIDLLCRSFSEDEIAKRMVLCFLSHNDAEVRKNCIPPIMERNFFFKNREKIINYAREEKEIQVRRIYTKYFSKKLGPFAELMLFNEDNKRFHDYLVGIDDRILETLVRGTIRRIKINRKVRDGTQFNPIDAATMVSHSEVVKATPKLEPILRKVKALGLPLKLEYNLSYLEDKNVPN
ncbi:pentapeptide repeat-containing protein [Brucellaceae bacterium D45D]